MYKSDTVTTLRDIHPVPKDLSAAAINYKSPPHKNSWTEIVFEPYHSQGELGVTDTDHWLQRELCPSKALRGSQTTAGHAWVLSISPVGLHHGSLALWKDSYNRSAKGWFGPDWLHCNTSTAPLQTSWLSSIGNHRERRDPLQKGRVDYHRFVL